MLAQIQQEQQRENDILAALLAHWNIQWTTTLATLGEAAPSYLGMF
jgi:hypothetical protein